MRGDTWALGLAGVSAFFAILALVLWIPWDVETGVVETFRRQTTIGDAMAPTAAAAGLLVAAMALGFTEYFRGGCGTKAPLDRQSVIFIFRMGLVIAAGLVVMFHLGPVVVEAVNAISGEIGDYRQLRDTVPYKYLGYLTGGSILIAGMIAIIEQRLTIGIVITATVAAAGLTIFYDVPFEDLLLPPNGDQ